MLAGLAECERLIATDALRAVTTGGWIQPEGGERMTPTSAPSCRCAATRTRSTTPSARRGWGRMPPPSSIPSCACAGSRVCAWPTHRSCRR